MLEMMVTALAIGTTKFIGDLALTNAYIGSWGFAVGDVKTKIDYDAKLDLARRNFHLTIDLDINY